MTHKEKRRNSLLFLTVLMPCLGFSQTSNVGGVYVKSGTVMSIVDPLINNIGAELVNDGELYVYSNLKNDGKVSFTSGLRTGAIKLYGQKNAALAISGTGSTAFYNVEFNNDKAQPGFQLSSGLNIFGKADFQNGIVDNVNFAGSMVFEKGSSAVNADDLSYVNGLVVKKGNDSFVYPIGDGNKYRSASISAPSQVGDVFTGRYFFKNPGTLYPITNLGSSLRLIDNAEYWTVERTIGNSNVFLTLSWNESTSPAAIYAEPYDEIHIVRWDVATNSWVDQGGVADAAKKEVVTVTDPVTGYGVFTLARVKKPVDKTINFALNYGISPNGDGVNDVLVFNGLEAYPDNKVTVFDRYGRVLFETTAYNTNGNVFRGVSKDNSNDILPLGTYFYTVDYLDEASGQRVKKSNYLYINLR
jgi:gliding motility-associated-like protein